MADWSYQDYQALKYVEKMLQEDPKGFLTKIEQDKEAIKLSQRLREEGKIVGMFYGKPSKALEYANSYKINKVIFVGGKEIKSKEFKVKDMDSGKETKLEI